MACQRVGIFTLITYMFDFSRLCVFKCLLKSCGSWHAKEHWLHPTVRFQMLLQTTRYVFFRCLFKVPTSEDGLSY